MFRHVYESATLTALQEGAQLALAGAWDFCAAWGLRDPSSRTFAKTDKGFGLGVKALSIGGSENPQAP